MANPQVIICDCDHKHVNQEIEVFKKENIDIKWLQCKT